MPAGAPPVLVNLGADLPPDWQTFDRIIEVLSTDPDDAQRGRGRWRTYKAAGMAIKHHGAAD